MSTEDRAQSTGNKATGQLPQTARVVIIGGGAVGASVLYHLAKAGWTDCLLLEKNELTSGSTWHAAGNCPNYVANQAIMRMQSYSVNLYQTLGDEVDYPMNYHVTGAVRLAHSRQRMEEFRHVGAMGRQMGIEFQELTNQEMKELYPFLETHDLCGGQLDPTDGDIDPAQLTQAFAKGARDLGAEIIRFCPVTGVERDNGEWIIKTDIGTVRCEYVVNAAGYRADEVGAMFGRFVPCVAMAHQYLVTEEIDALVQRDELLPLLRDPDSSYYLRQEKNGLLLGPYEYNCKAHWITSDDPRPEDFSFQLWPDDLERLEWYIDDACRRVPILGEAGITRVVNGPISYAPDGLPLIGPMPGVPNAFEACVFTFGIVQAGGAGKLLSEIIIEGEPEKDSWSVDPRRFTDHVDQKYSIAKAIETYSHEYAMHFPHMQWPAARKVKTSKIYDTLAAKRASFGVYGGWEKVEYFLNEGEDETMIDSYDRPSYFASVGAECRHVAEHVGLLDIACFSRYEVKGAGARAWLERLTTGRVPKVGRIGLIYFATEKGKTLTEMTANCFADDHFWLLCPSAALWHDFEWLQKNLPDDNSLQVKDISRDITTFLLTGPKSPALMEEATGISMSQANFPWLTHQNVKIGDISLTAIRVSFVGEAGWEIHVAKDDSLAVWTTLCEVGENHQLGFFGMAALDSMRLEKGYRSWKHDISNDYTILESGLGQWVKFDKDDFIGKAALQAEYQRGAAKKFIILTIDDPEDDVPFGEALYLSSIRSGGQHIGEVISAGYGHRVEKSIVYGVVDAAADLNDLSVDVVGRYRKAHIVEGGILYDSKNEKVRA